MNLYSKIAAYYSKFSSLFFNRKDIFRFIEKSFLSFEIKKDCKILDIGCANAKLLFLLKRRGFEKLYGIDISSEMIELAFKKAVLKGIKLYNLNFLNFTSRKKFDVALCTMDVTNHIPNEQIFDFFKNVTTILKKNGILIFDINTKEYLQKLGKRRFVVKKIEDTLLSWKFSLNSKYLKINFSVKEKNGEVASEDIYQFIYDEEFIENILKDCGFEILRKVYDYRLPFKTRFLSKVCYVCKKIW
ncbi:Methyltransferase type 12 [Caldicellulosiruptor obsidiansis OB47]|jgi:2-polyprenyl-3-methyl-5-hydroxy-6-metoxy-1,4-benzoquinol methylase|uniref:Methyltransferase type 12 n=1 Tax=Caldicellulosiruptor obsidiansis (strain ATCC BAA-2073 / JCM 16842 / OB47) TaxID=608506 RepID=D9TJ15_CALOO|nr:class I SAM-dependent methyltransferase [Caldicellulosiruptor obsidiansis]ADL41997.1 Methyltransferase type 12 [Caldicellulosiruptor obsidiansis OB47]